MKTVKSILMVIFYIPLFMLASIICFVRFTFVITILFSFDLANEWYGEWLSKYNEFINSLKKDDLK